MIRHIPRARGRSSVWWSDGPRRLLAPWLALSLLWAAPATVVASGATQLPGNGTQATGSPSPAEVLGRIQTAQERIAGCPERAEAALQPATQALAEADSNLARAESVEPPSPPPPPPPPPQPGSDGFCVAFYNYFPFSQQEASGDQLKQKAAAGDFSKDDYQRLGKALHMNVAPGAADRTTYDPGSKHTLPFQMQGRNPQTGQDMKLNMPLLLEAAGTGDNCADLGQRFPTDSDQPIELGEDGTFTQDVDENGQSATITGGPLEEGWSDEAIAGNIEGLAEAIVLFDCFVATAVYAQADSPELRSLRRFRDDVLLDSPSGSRLVDLYYRIGPRAAVWLKHRPALRGRMRPLLDALAWGLDRLPTDSPLVRIVVEGGSRALEIWFDASGVSRLPGATIELFNPLDPDSALPFPAPASSANVRQHPTESPSGG